MDLPSDTVNIDPKRYPPVKGHSSHAQNDIRIINFLIKYLVWYW